jgi:predicted dehydrogenase
MCLSAFQNRRWDSDVLTMRSLLQAGRLGDVVRLESRFERYAPERGPRSAGGGTLLDYCSHLVDQALVLVGPVRTVYAEWRIRETDLDEHVFAALTHRDGVHSHLSASWNQGAPERRFRVTDTSAAYVVNGPMDGQEVAVLRGETPATLSEEWGVEPPERWGRLRWGDSQEVVPSLTGCWQRFYEQFAAAVQGTRAVPVTAWDAVETGQVLDAARRSANSGAVVAPEQLGGDA